MSHRTLEHFPPKLPMTTALLLKICSHALVRSSLVWIACCMASEPYSVPGADFAMGSYSSGSMD